MIGKSCYQISKVYVGQTQAELMYYVLKALPQVCTENTAWEACREIHTARGEAEYCNYFGTHPQVLYFLYTRAQAVL